MARPERNTFRRRLRHGAGAEAGPGGRARRLWRAAHAPFVLLTTVALALGTAPAQADTGYRYWSVWEQEGESADWTYATQGPGTLRPADGDVVGFRFVLSAGSAEAPRPRLPADFQDVCADTPPDPDGKRVALVLDFGTDTDAPGGEEPPEPRTACAPVPNDATASEALAEVAGPLRYDSSALLCAIADYPGQGCGEQVGSDHAEGKTDVGAADEADDGQGSRVATFVAVGVVLLLGAAAVIRSRRSR